MFEVGDMIVYGSEGVCRVVSVGTPAISGINRSKQYYTLKPQYCDGMIFAPVDTPVRLRPVMTKEEAEQLIRALPGIQVELPVERLNVRMLSDHYKELMHSSDRVDIVRLIKEVHQKRARQQAMGGKVSQVDERYMKRAEDLLYGELSVSLGIPKEQVSDYITQTVEQLGQAG